MTVVSVGATHPYRMYSISTNNQLEPFVPDLEDYMAARQSLPNVYIRSGEIYLTRRLVITEDKNLIGKNPSAIIIDQSDSYNIDSPADLVAARMRAKQP